MSRAPFVIVPELAAIAVDYTGVNAARKGYIADILMPRVRVESMEFQYPTVPLDGVFTVYDNQVDRLGRLNEIYSKSDMATGAVLDYGLSEPIPYRDEMQAAAQSLPFNLRARAVRNVTDKNQIAREIRVAALLQSASSYGSQTEDETATPWTADDFDIGGTVTTALDSMLLPANTAFMSQKVYRLMQTAPSLAVKLGGQFTKGKALKDDEIMTALGVSKLVVGNTLKQTSKRGQTLSTGAIWGDHFGLLHIPAVEEDGFVNDVDVPAFGLTFQWGDIVSGEVPDPDIGLRGGVRVRSGESIVEKITAPLGGYLFRNVLG